MVCGCLLYVCMNDFLYACRDIVQMIICVFLTCIHLYACIYDMCMYCMNGYPYVCGITGILGIAFCRFHECMYVCM